MLKNTLYLKPILTYLSLFVTNSAFAGAGITLGATSSYNYDSNVFKSSTAVESGQYYQVNPKASLTLSHSKLSFLAGYSGGYSFYPDTPENDVENITGFGTFAWRADERRAFDIKGSYSNVSLPRESFETTVSPNDPVEFVELKSLAAKTAFPLPKNNYDLLLQAGASDSNYTGSDAAQKNKYLGNATAELKYRYSGKTSLVYGYKIAGESLKSDLYLDLNDLSQTLYVGARWLTTGKTSSHVLLGYEILQLSGPATSSYGGLNIDISIVWARKSYSKATLTVARSSKDSLFYGTGFLINNSIGLEFSHALTGHWSLGSGANIYANQSYAEFKHLGGTVSIHTRYVIRWISVGVTSGYQFRHSLENSNSSFSGYTAAAELSISI